MINHEKLKDSLVKYKASFEKRWPDERYKWRAVKWFQEHWDINADNFYEMFTVATDKTFNLLVSMNNFPRGMIQVYAEQDKEAVREMFIDLYDESKPVTDRIARFQVSAQALCDRLSPGKQHYQRPMAITVYLWLKYPSKYDVFKYSVCKSTCQYLENTFIPKKGNIPANIKGNKELIDEILTEVEKDEELLTMYKAKLDDKCYYDQNYRTLAFDISFYIANYLNVSEEKKEEWLAGDYNPGISKEQWVKLLNDDEVFTDQALEIVTRMRDYGGQATCSQLSTKYGETANFYNLGSTALAKRIAKKTGCELRVDEEGVTRYWSLLYIGRYTDKDEEGAFLWKLRDELAAALEEVDLSEVALYAEAVDEKQYWWLNANPKIWSFADISIGEVQSYTLYNDNGNKRRIFQNFLDAKPGDLVIGYESNPVKQVVALARISQENDGKNLYFEKVEGLSVPIDYAALKDIAELERMEYFQNPQGSLFKLTKGEYDLIMDMIREENPLPENTEQLETYTREDFLSEVYMTGDSYDALKNILMKKQNIILQGAPGVGKTFAAKRLAYSVMGVKDENRIEFIQFHQNYSYEDFIMGYKPVGEGFELQYGIFYKFCMKAANNPEVPYFFIIDEINRGNMSKIFGELLMLIEKDYRGTKATMAYNGLPFAVPKNLYIIGMMNTADRSLAMIDYALRRRFSFFPMEPGFESDGFRKYLSEINDDTLYALIDVVSALNKAIKEDPSLGSGFSIGHSYFCGKKPGNEEDLAGWMTSIVDYDIIPMLEEYWFDEPDKIRLWRNRLNGVFNS
ncbi:restriction endonuclease [Oribacterium sp. C9]|uniref:AAA family ATPase n=1 Tax=Oribacterium sp. C9 TaxID=1943579 RepID=UPI00098EB767|nr:AAA family ATPase [Oribacterium sp. C9]OON85764.1 restriction endonuclease [Oribacterium sp. C9]